MKKKGNILINSILVLSISTFFFINMGRSNERTHNFETVSFERNMPVTYVDYTVELFYEDINMYLDSYIADPTLYNAAEFRSILINRIDGLMGFTYVGDDVEDLNIKRLTNFGQILKNNGYSMDGTDTYQIDIDVDGFTGEFIIVFDYHMTEVYIYDSYKDDRKECNKGNTFYCVRSESDDSWNSSYDFDTDGSSVTLTETN